MILGLPGVVGVLGDCLCVGVPRRRSRRVAELGDAVGVSVDSPVGAARFASDSAAKESGLALGLGMAAEGEGIAVGDRPPLVLGAVASPGMDKDQSWLEPGLVKIGGAGVTGGMGMTGGVWGAFALGVLGMTGSVWGTFMLGAPGRAGVVPGTVPDGILGLGDGTRLPTGGSDGNVSGEDSGGVGTPGTSGEG